MSRISKQLSLSLYGDHFTPDSYHNIDVQHVFTKSSLHLERHLSTERLCNVCVVLKVDCRDISVATTANLLYINLLFMIFTGFDY